MCNKVVPMPSWGSNRLDLTKIVAIAATGGEGLTPTGRRPLPPLSFCRIGGLGATADGARQSWRRARLAPPPGAPISISRPTARRQPLHYRSWGGAEVLHSQAVGVSPFYTSLVSFWQGGALATIWARRIGPTRPLPLGDPTAPFGGISVSRPDGHLLVLPT